MAAPALPRGRGGAAAPSERGGSHGKDSPSHTSRHCACHVARMPRRRGRVPCGETEGEVGGTPGMPAGQAGGAGMAEGGARPDHTRICLRIAPERGAGDVAGRLGDMGATMPRERHHERGGLRAGTGRRGRGATTRAPSAPASRSPGGTSGGSPTGAAQGSGNAPDGGPAAAATGPSRQCRCRDGPLWGVTKALGYAGGSLLRAHLELGAGFQDPEFGRDTYSCCERANPSGFANATGAFIRRDAHDVRSQKECRRLRLPSKRPVLSQRCRWVVT